VRIGHAVKHQNQRLLAFCQRLVGLRGFELLQQFVQRMHLRQLLHPGGDALVTMAAAELGQTHAVGLDQAHTGFIDLVNELPHARIAPGGLKIYFDDGSRRGFKAHAHGMKAEQNFG
jgi:hypothetical protein